MPIEPDGLKDCVTNSKEPHLPAETMPGLTPGGASAAPTGDKTSLVAHALADHSRRDVARDRVTAVVPARNEESVIATCVRGLARQPEIAEILVVDDQSSDGTAGVVRGLTAELAGVRLVEAPGWLLGGWERTMRLGRGLPRLRMAGCCLPMPMRSFCRARRRGRCRLPGSLVLRWSRFHRSR